LQIRRVSGAGAGAGLLALADRARIHDNTSAVIAMPITICIVLPNFIISALLLAKDIFQPGAEGNKKNKLREQYA
jgi:hypothetical protein